MAPINIRGERPAGDANDLAAGEIDGNWLSLWGVPSLLTIVSGVITINGSGTYRVNPESGSADDVTGIAGAQRVGDECAFLNATPGHVLTYKHQGNLHMLGVDFASETIYSIIKFRCVVLSPMTWVEVSRSANQ